MRRNRWLIALAAVGIHICIGSVYAWSVLTKPVMAAMGLTLSETTWAFSLAILFLGMSAGFLGGFVERIGPSRSGLVSALFFGTGLLGTARAVHMHSSALLSFSTDASEASALAPDTSRRFPHSSNGSRATEALRQAWQSWDSDLPH